MSKMAAIEQTSVIRLLYKHPYSILGTMVVLILLFILLLPENRHQTSPTVSLHEAAINGDIETIKQALISGRSVDERDDCQWTPLMRAAQTGHNMMTDYLINMGADVNAVDKAGYSVLTTTAIFNNPDTLKLLIQAEALIDYQDPEMGWTALIWSAKENHLDNVTTLLALGADRHIRDYSGQTAYDWAIQNNASDIASLLGDESKN